MSLPITKFFFFQKTQICMTVNTLHTLKYFAKAASLAIQYCAQGHSIYVPIYTVLVIQYKSNEPYTCVVDFHILQETHNMYCWARLYNVY